MADTIQGQGCTDGIESSNTLILASGEASRIDINCVNVPEYGVDKTEMEIAAPLKGMILGMKGDQDGIITGKKTTDTTVINEATKGKTASLILQNASNKGLTWKQGGEEDTNSAARGGDGPGKGKTELIVNGGKFKQGDVTTATRKAKDYIEFGSNAIVTNSSIATGKGADTIVFGGDLKLKKTTTVETGKGKDIVQIGETRRGKGKLLLSDFSKKDRLVVGGEGGEVLKLKDIQNGDAPKWVKLDA